MQVKLTPPLLHTSLQGFTATFCLPGKLLFISQNPSYHLLAAFPSERSPTTPSQPCTSDPRAGVVSASSSVSSDVEAPWGLGWAQRGLWECLLNE